MPNWVAYLLGVFTVPTLIGLWSLFILATESRQTICDVCDQQSPKWRLGAALWWWWHTNTTGRTKPHRAGLRQWRIDHNRDPKTGEWLAKTVPTSVLLGSAPTHEGN